LTEVAVVGFNYFYYRSILPNTYYAKRMAIGPALRSGFKYVITTMGPNYSTSIGIGRRFDQLLLAGTDVLIVVGFVVAVTQRKRLGYVAAAVAAQVIFVLTSGGDWMMGGRFLAPVLPQLIVLEVVGALAIWTWAKRNVRTDVVVVAIFGGMVLAATYSYVTPGSRDPVWNMRHGINNRALIAVGGYGDGGRVWAAMPNLIACARPGQLVATSEAGYGPFSALGVRFLDLRGLTNREIAMSAPASMKAPTGVTDINWQQSTSPVGAVIVRSMPVLIVTLDARPEPIVLNGHYKLLGTESFGLTRMKVYERAGVHCPPLVRS
jgi:hypothetical protein